jgi:hypothetical protein
VRQNKEEIEKNKRKGGIFKFNMEYKNKPTHSVYISEYGHQVSRAD